ncbi:uncharacterized protein LOC114740488 [Neltuma alba]|uniref:uncharacterized protein LOC114740488 n=1 Tax=Neltuma alba TaxID=207710 RepID=UPI0010A51837|nr:uncharacterized protein LOC114740488 [Prosopis alba]
MPKTYLQVLMSNTSSYPIIKTHMYNTYTSSLTTLIPQVLTFKMTTATFAVDPCLSSESESSYDGNSSLSSLSATGFSHSNFVKITTEDDRGDKRRVRLWVNIVQMALIDRITGYTGQKHPEENCFSVSLLCHFILSAALGAILHVISTSLLGITAITMANTIAGEETVHKLASILLIFLGGGYVLLFLSGKGGHSHSHNQPMEKMAVAGLILVPALSPCATTLPVFLAVGNSSSMMVLAIIVLLLSTITVMTSLVALSFYGASQLKFHWVERYDKLLVGSVLCLVGVLTLIFHDHDHDGDLSSFGGHSHRKIISP